MQLRLLKLWPRLHPSTYVVTFCVAVMLFFLIVPGREVLNVELPRFPMVFEHGWPFTFVWRRTYHEDTLGNLYDVSCWSVSEGSPTWYYAFLIADVFIAAALVAGCAAVCEARRRRRQNFFHFGLKGLALAVATIAAICAYFGHVYREHQNETAVLRGAGSGIYTVRTEIQPTTLTWVRELAQSFDADFDCFDRCAFLSVGNNSKAAWGASAHLKRLKAIQIYGQTKSDLRFLDDVTASLEWLDIQNAHKDLDLSRLVRFSRLRRLSVLSAHFDPSELTRLKVFGNLLVLELRFCDLKDAALQELSHLTRLTSLSLDGNAVTDQGLGYLVDLNSLRELQLRWTEMTDAGVDHLSRLVSLEHLDIRDTNVTYEGMTRLQKALPNLVVEWSRRDAQQ